jgi:hypothetical protein
MGPQRADVSPLFRLERDVIQPPPAIQRRDVEAIRAPITSARM